MQEIPAVPKLNTVAAPDTKDHYVLPNRIGLDAAREKLGRRTSHRKCFSPDLLAVSPLTHKQCVN